MIFKNETSLVTFGDFLDVYHKLRQKGMGYLLANLQISEKARVTSKWNFYESSSDFWIIPEINQDWNKIITGDPQLEYEDYVAQKYLEGKSGLRILSVGCGEGAHERKFMQYTSVAHITGVDISEHRVNTARALADKENLNIDYIANDFYKIDFKAESFDLVLFSSSLHHFSDINGLLTHKIKPLLKRGGLLVIYEYCGPNRLQWRDAQLKEANKLLKTLPHKYKTLYDGKTVKRKVYRPGLIRMLAVDPSEAPDSENLVTAIHNNYKTIEEAKLGWNILAILLKGIAHNFVNDEPETKQLLAHLIEKEEEFFKRTGEYNSVFGVYQKS